MGYGADASTTRGHALGSTRVSGNERDLRYRERGDEYVSRSTDDARVFAGPEEEITEWVQFNIKRQDEATHIKLGGTNKLALTHVACVARQFPVPHHYHNNA